MVTKPDQVSQKEFKLVPAGTHLARCYGFIHLGHIPNTHPQALSALVNKIRLTWELPEEMTTFKEGDEPKPFVVSQEFTLSMNEKSNLRKMVQSWFGKVLTDEECENFDAESLVGMDCLITISHVEKNGKTYSSIQNVTKLPSKMSCPAPVNAPTVVTWETITKESFAKLPKFLQEKMQQATEYSKFAGANGIDLQAF